MNPEEIILAIGSEWPETLNNSTMLPVFVIFFVCMTLSTLVWGGLIYTFMKVVSGGGSTRELRRIEHQDNESIQQLQRGFHRMEERMGSMELLLLGPSSELNTPQTFGVNQLDPEGR